MGLLKRVIGVHPTIRLLSAALILDLINARDYQQANDQPSAISCQASNPFTESKHFRIKLSSFSKVLETVNVD